MRGPVLNVLAMSHGVTGKALKAQAPNGTAVVVVNVTRSHAMRVGGCRVAPVNAPLTVPARRVVEGRRAQTRRPS